MPTAEIITIGTELLLGEIQDTNTRHMARVPKKCWNRSVSNNNCWG